MNKWNVITLLFLLLSLATNYLFYKSNVWTEFQLHSVHYSNDKMEEFNEILFGIVQAEAAIEDKASFQKMLMKKYPNRTVQEEGIYVSIDGLFFEFKEDKLVDITW